MKIGIDLGGTNIAIGVVDSNHNIIAKHSHPTPKATEDITNTMASLTTLLLSDLDLSVSDIDSVGVAAPGWIDIESGVIVASSNLGHRDYPMAAELSKRVGISVKVANDADCAGIAEAVAGAGRGRNPVVMLTIGTGVGGALIFDGKIYRGKSLFSPEFGHMTLNMDGPLCNCGRRGCVENYLSATALIKMAKDSAKKHSESLLNSLGDGDIDGKVIFSALQRGDSATVTLFGEYVHYFVQTITNIANAFCPEIVVIGGGISGAGDLLLTPILKQMPNAAEGYTYGSIYPEVKLATLGNDAGIIGATLI